MFDLVTVGHFSIDTITATHTTSPKRMLGGPPTYVSLAAARLGTSVSVVSKVGEGFPNRYVKWLKAQGVDLSGLQRVKGASNTQFVLDYTDFKRRLRLKSRAPNISLEDIPTSMRARAIHVAPIVNEINQDVFDELRGRTTLLLLDPQGFVRSFDKQGSVRLKPWEGQQALEHIDAYKSSTEEIEMTTGLKNPRSAMKRIHDLGVKVVLVTKGVKGSVLLSENVFYDVPACRSRVVFDPTGAGDAYSGAFLAEYLRGKEPLWCACVGAAAASFVVEGLGPTVFGERRETYARASEIYEKGIKRSVAKR